MFSEILSSSFEDRESVLALANTITAEDWNSLGEMMEQTFNESGFQESISGIMGRITAALELPEDYDEAKDAGILGLINDTFKGLDGLNEFDFTPFTKNVETTVTDVAHTVQPMEEAFGNAASAVGDLDEKIGTVASTASGKAGSFGSLTSAIEEVGSAAEDTNQAGVRWRRRTEATGHAVALSLTTLRKVASQVSVAAQTQSRHG